MSYTPLFFTMNPPNRNSWVGFDLDGTLAMYSGWSNTVGPAIPQTLNLLKAYLAHGFKVKIFTARASAPEAIPAVRNWVIANIGEELEITNVKDLGCLRIYDDIAVGVEFNTGVIHGQPKEFNTVVTNYVNQKG